MDEADDEDENGSPEEQLGGRGLGTPETMFAVVTAASGWWTIESEFGPLLTVGLLGASLLVGYQTVSATRESREQVESWGEENGWPTAATGVATAVCGLTFGVLRSVRLAAIVAAPLVRLVVAVGAAIVATAGVAMLCLVTVAVANGATIEFGATAPMFGSPVKAILVVIGFVVCMIGLGPKPPAHDR